MSGHTKGPWRVENGRAVYGGYGFFNRIAEIEGCHEESNIDATREDLSLIAAAPDLLAACKAGTEISERTLAEDGGFRTPEAQAVYDMVCAAIAKAEGR